MGVQRDPAASGADKLTIVDVSKAAGVSVSTVSAVINGRTKQARISEKTAQRVLETIERLRYQPHHLAQSLRRGRTGLLGLTVSSLRDPFYAEFCMHFGATCRAHGYGMFLTDIRDSATGTPSMPAATGHLGVDGVVTLNTRQSPWHPGGRVSDPVSSPIPTIVVASQEPLARWERYPDGNALILLTELGGRLAARHLAGRGCRRFAYIPHAIAPENRPGFREHGFSDELRKLGIPREEVILAPLQGSAYGSVRALLDGGWFAHRPVGLYVQSDLGALEVLRAVQEAGLRIPSDVAVIGTNGSQFGAMTTPPLSSVSLLVETVAQTAVHWLLEAIGSGSPAAVRPVRHVSPELVLRASA